jgi:hypothetical protein
VVAVLGLGLWQLLGAGPADRGGAGLAALPARALDGAGRGTRGRPAVPPRLLPAEHVAAPTFPTSAEAFEAQVRSPEPRHPIDFHRDEPRDERWARAMERTLAARFSPAALAQEGLRTMKLDQVECRRSSCRLEISWGEADMVAAASIRPNERSWPDPVEYFQMRTGPFATIGSRARPRPDEFELEDSWRIRVRGDGRFAVTTVLLYAQKDLDPARFAAGPGGALARRAND